MAVALSWIRERFFFLDAQVWRSRSTRCVHYGSPTDVVFALPSTFLPLLLFPLLSMSIFHYTISLSKVISGVWPVIWVLATEVCLIPRGMGIVKALSYMYGLLSPLYWLKPPVPRSWITTYSSISSAVVFLHIRLGLQNPVVSSSVLITKIALQVPSAVAFSWRV